MSFWGEIRPRSAQQREILKQFDKSINSLAVFNKICQPKFVGEFQPMFVRHWSLHFMTILFMKFQWFKIFSKLKFSNFLIASWGLNLISLHFPALSTI